MSEENKTEQRVQSRTFSVILYEDTESYNCSEVLANCTEYFDEWAYILHDRDVMDDGSPKKNHYHVVGRLSGPRSPSAVANKIGVPANYVECKKGYTFKKGFRYLAHLDDPGKAPYFVADIVTNVEDTKAFTDPYGAGQQAKAIFEKIVVEKTTSPAAVLDWVFQEGYWSEFRRGFAVWQSIMAANRLEK